MEQLPSFQQQTHLRGGTPVRPVLNSLVGVEGEVQLLQVPHFKEEDRDLDEDLQVHPAAEEEHQLVQENSDNQESYHQEDLF